jgi:hypothetical protein
LQFNQFILNTIGYQKIKFEKLQMMLNFQHLNDGTTIEFFDDGGGGTLKASYDIQHASDEF